MTARVDPTLFHLRDEQRTTARSAGRRREPPAAACHRHLHRRVAAIEALGFVPVDRGRSDRDRMAPRRGARRLRRVAGGRACPPRLTSRLVLTRASRHPRRPSPQGGFHLDGTGVIVGVIDTGIDIYHQCFRRTTARRASSRFSTAPSIRIHRDVGGPRAATSTSGSAAGRDNHRDESVAPVQCNCCAGPDRAEAHLDRSWRHLDQGRPATDNAVQIDSQAAADPDCAVRVRHPHGSNPSPAGPTRASGSYTGRESPRAEIDDALNASRPAVPAQGRERHGTHVAGTAAGDGSQAEKCE